MSFSKGNEEEEFTDGEEDPQAELDVTTDEEEEEGHYPEEQHEGRHSYIPPPPPPDDDDQDQSDQTDRDSDDDIPQDEEPALEFIKHPKKEHPNPLSHFKLGAGNDDDDDGDIAQAVKEDEKEKEDDDDDDDDLLMPKPSQSMISIHVSRMSIKTRDEARIIAEEVMQILEEDVAAYLENNAINLDYLETQGLEEKEEIPREKISGSSISVSSNISETLPGDPSKLKLFYAKGENLLKNEGIPPIHGGGVDESCEVALHRSRRWHKGTRPGHADGEAQTKDMTFISQPNAQLLFMELYPKPDDWVPPPVTARHKSMAVVVDAAEHEDPLVDRSRLGPKVINFSNRKKLLQPLRDDYYKDESFWTGSRFRGQYKNKQFFKGEYDHPTGVQYESEWKDGHFHTTHYYGMMTYPRGDFFEGQWYKGRYTSGEITFGDGLVYHSGNWSYCEAPDRRLRIERYLGVKPAGNTIFNDLYPMQKLPPGCYDIGDGIYNPKTGEVRGFDGFLQRKVTIKEHEWIKQFCRKQPTPEEEFIPTFSPERIPGTSMEQLNRFHIARKRKH